MRAHLDFFEHLRNELGFEVELLHDIHERLAPIEAVQFAKDMEPFKLFFLEDPLAPEEIGYFIPEPGKGTTAPQTNDVAMDHRGLLYVTDKAHGFDVIEFTG